MRGVLVRELTVLLDQHAENLMRINLALYVVYKYIVAIYNCKIYDVRW